MDITIKLIAYAVGAVSVVGIVSSLGYDLKRIRQRLRVNRAIKYDLYSEKWLQFKLLNQYNHLLAATLSKYKYQDFPKVVLSQLYLFLLLFVASGFLLKSITYGFLTAFCIAYVFPVGFLIIRHKRIQSSIQGDIKNSAVELLQLYQKNHYKMIFALKELTERTEGTTQVVYAKLFARMNDNDDVKILAAETFAFQLGYIRGSNLATAILKACKDDLNVEVLLKDLIADMTQLNKEIKNAETEANETAILGFAPLPLTAVLMYLNYQHLIPGGKYFEVQFGNPSGLRTFILSIIFGVIGIALAILVKRPKK